MNILWYVIAVVAYLGVAMAFYFGFTVSDDVGEPDVNACAALAWPLILLVCVVIGPFFSFWIVADLLHRGQLSE